MNKEQLEILKTYRKREQAQAAYMERCDETLRQTVKQMLHGGAMVQFRMAAKPKNSKPPRKLTKKPCNPDCVLCHPKLLKQSS